MSKHAYENAETNETIDIIVMDEKYTPTYSHDTDAGADVRTRLDIVLPPRSVTQVPIGVKLSQFKEIWTKIEGRSSLAAQGIFPVGGVIDPDYQGEVLVLLANITDEPFEIQEGDRIAQLVIHARYQLDFNIVESFETETERGENGLGSTGVQ